MELAGVIKEIGEKELVIETPEETLRLPKSVYPGAQVGQSIYINCSNEPARQAREIVNELLSANETN